MSERIAALWATSECCWFTGPITINAMLGQMSVAPLGQGRLLTVASPAPLYDGVFLILREAGMERDESAIENGGVPLGAVPQEHLELTKRSALAAETQAVSAQSAVQEARNAVRAAWTATAVNMLIVISTLVAPIIEKTLDADGRQTEETEFKKGQLRMSVNDIRNAFYN